MNHQNFYFSVITAAYNCASWVGPMLNSLVKQSLDFEAHIQVVIIDDGSSDQTATVIHKWVDQFPNNIIFIQKENGGPASARNLGLQHATGKWITFIDSDDFVAPSYFQTIQDFLTRTRYDGPVVVANTLLFYDAQQQVVDGHPLSYKFKDTRVTDLLAEPTYIQLFTNTCFFRKTILDKTKHRFDERIKPTFEDAHFLNTFLLRSNDSRLAFIKEAHYFYRKRGSGTGLVEGGWVKPEKFNDQILFGYLNLAQQYQRIKGHIPEFIQNIFLYEYHWYLSRILDGQLTAEMTEESIERFLELSTMLFKYVDARHILLSNLPALELRTRIAMLKAFKNARFCAAPFILAEISLSNNEVLLQHWATDEAPYGFKNDNADMPLLWEKRILHRLGSRVLCQEYLCWPPLDESNPGHPEADGEKVGVISRDLMLESLKPSKVLQSFYLPATLLPEPQKSWRALASTSEAQKFHGTWILMDRVHKADDNAEHLCRWILQNHPEHKILFVLDRKSNDWPRLEQEGFPLVSYRSSEHFMALGQAAWLISSHVDIPVTDPMGTRTAFGLPKYKVAFLQHGIIMHDLSRWLNQFSLDCMVTSVHPEYESLIGGRYKFTEREIVLAGLPRHDALLRKAQARKPGRTILFCPTWREHLRRTEAHIPGLNAEEAKNFQQSDYFIQWNAVTSSPSLARLAREHGARLLFLPHPEIGRFLPLFQRSDAFSFLNWTDLKSVQDLLASCAMAVTDYSSFALEMGYIGRPVAYYQFPETPDFISTQMSRGYFSYDEHGLGPILRTREALENWIQNSLRQGSIRQEPYNTRADNFFALRDGQNCRRVYEAIINRT